MPEAVPPAPSLGGLVAPHYDFPPGVGQAGFALSYAWPVPWPRLVSVPHFQRTAASKLNFIPHTQAR